MASEITLRPNPSSPRPQTLVMPDLAAVLSTPSILRSSSYSPFPAILGSNMDPHNLDQFLLPPGDPAWSYSDPLPASAEIEVQPVKDASLGRKGLKKVRSLSMLHRPSPLSQPPVSAEGSDRPAIRRKRSSSVDSNSTTRSREEPEEVLDDMLTMRPGLKEPSRSFTKDSMRKALHMTRRSIFLARDSSTESVEVTVTPQSSAMSTPSTSTRSSEDIGPSTPMSSRSASNQSEISSASSSSSSEGIKTPSEALPTNQLDVEIAGGKLAVALASANDKRTRKGSWRGWLGGKRANKVYDTAGSGNVTPSDISAETSPNVSAIALNTQIPQLTLTPSPSFTSSPPRLGRNGSHKAYDADEARLDARTRAVIEDLRQLSYVKLGQLRAPSPHPLALALKRQYSNLPDEVAIFIKSGQKVFPRSTNGSSASPGLSPMQSGLHISLAIKNIIGKLDCGECPAGLPDSPFSGQKHAPSRVVCQTQGVLDFINRPPFEERNIVLYPNATFSPISMARPGYGVWDLDFSAHIMALARVDGKIKAPWPTLPRASIGSPLEGVEAVIRNVPQPSPSSDESEEILVSPGMLPTISLTDEPVVAEPLESISSFRKARQPSQTWDDSSDEEEESDEEDEAPLASIAKKPAPVALIVPKPSATVAPRTMKPVAARTQVNDEASRRRNMDEVARARERRSANMSGETERKAEAERYQKRPSLVSQKHLSNRRESSTSQSSTGSRPPTVHVSAASPPAADPRASRRRVKSTYDTLAPPTTRPDTQRHRSADGTSGMPKQRYHSFYEVPQTSSIPVHPQPIHPQPVYQAPPMYAHPAMASFAALPHSSSMMFPAYPQMAYPTMPMPMASHANLYLAAQAAASRSSLPAQVSYPSPRRHSRIA